MNKMSKRKKMILKVFLALFFISVATIITNISGSIALDEQSDSKRSMYESVNPITGAISLIIQETQPPKPTEISEPSTAPEHIQINYIKLTDDEIYELATLVWLEARGESYECQKAVASVVINRMTTGELSLHDVIYAKNQFSPAYLISTNCPDDSTLAAVHEIIMNGPSIPEYVTYFKAGYYHNFSDSMINYIQIDNTYFSYDSELYNKLAGECE